MTCPFTIRSLLAGLILVGVPSLAHADYKDDIGLTALLAELGAAAPDGAGISVSQVEGVSPDPHYAPNAADTQLAGKTLTYKSGNTGGYSGHATLVGKLMYGTIDGVAPGVTQIDAYEISNWLQNGFLKWGVGGSPEPATENRRLQNHSWVLNNQLNDGQFNDILRRLDYAIERDGFLAVVGVDNLTNNPLPALLSHSYNSLSVGITTGNHSFDPTRSGLDGPGRIKPEIVAPVKPPNYGTSYSCGLVSGATALLLETADGSAGLSNARDNSEVIKAILLAGAEKFPYATWARTPTQPLDRQFGAGRLNVQRSHHILVAGEHNASASTTVPDRGWDFATTGSGAALYFFDVPAGHALTNFSVILTWNRQVSDGSGPGFGNLQPSIANMDLRLLTASGFTPGTLLDSSVSPVDNIEHIFTWLGPGRYALQVSSTLSGANYALAWGGTPQVLITTTAAPSDWGSVSPASGYYDLGTSTAFAATPEPYYLFDHWTGDLSGATNPMPVTLTDGMSVTAHFVEQLTTNHPTPYWWLAQYGYTSNQETIVESTGANGYPLWQSYIADLDPTDPQSQLKLTSQTLINATTLRLTWETASDRVYTIESAPTARGPFSPLPDATDLPSTVQSFDLTVNPPPAEPFFRLAVQLE